MIVNKYMIAKAFAKRLLNHRALFNFAKSASTQTDSTTASTKRGAISQVIGAVVDVQFEG